MMPETKLHHREHYDAGRTQRFAFFALAFGFAESFFIYLLSSYFEEVLGSPNVSIFYLIAFSLVLAGLFFLHTIVRRIGIATTILFLLIFAVILQTMLALLPLSFFGAALALLYIASTTLGWVVLDIALERYSDDRHSGRIRGLHLFASSIGYFLGPILSTFTLNRYGFSGIFVGGLLLYSLLLIGGIVTFWGINPRPGKIARPWSAFREAWRRADIRRIWTISFAMEFFYAVMIVYTSIRLRELDMPWGDIGIVIALALLAFPLLQYPLGFLADKKYGEKEFLLISLVIAGSATAAVSFLSTTNVAIWGGVLFLTRVGIAGVEVLRDSYFYKRIDGDDDAMIAFFRSARPMGNIIGAILTGLWLLLLPLSSIFLLPSFLLFLAILPAWQLEDNKSEQEV